jgi:hypothetical protein
MSVKFFDGNNWLEIKAAYIYHEGIGFVTMSSIRCFANGEWQIVAAGNRQLIGAK